MATFEAARNKYVSDSVTTMSPGQLIVALYDRVLLDLEKALSGLAESDVYATHTALTHAQEIVHELLTSLDVKQWPGGASLAAVYRRVQDLLVAANVRKDSEPILECKAMLVPLRDAWREAAGLVPAGFVTAGPTESVDWRAALDQLDADLTATEAALEHGAPEAQRAVPELLSQFPAAPMPADLAPRAEALLARTRRLEALANEEIEGIRGTLRSLAGHRPAPPATTGRIVDFDA